MRPSRLALALAALAGALALAAALAGALAAEELYSGDTAFRRAGNRGSDVVTLALALPVLAVSGVLYRRGSARGGVALAGVLAWFLYLYASMSLGTAFNDLFLVYVGAFSASLFALLLTLASLDPRRLARSWEQRLPRRLGGWFLVGSGVLTAWVWLEPLVRSAAGGDPPRWLAGNTTMVTDALDLALIVPLVIAAGVLVLRGDGRGWVIAVPLLGLLVVLGAAIPVQTVLQVSAGIDFTTAEIVGPIAGFVVFAAAAAWLLALLVRAAPRVRTTHARHERRELQQGDREVDAAPSWSDEAGGGTRRPRALRSSRALSRPRPRCYGVGTDGDRAVP